MILLNDYANSIELTMEIVMVLVCEICGKSRDVGRRQCRDCYLELVRQRAKKRKRYTYSLTCQACGSDFTGWRKQSVLCPVCYKSRTKYKHSQNTNNYVYATDYKEGIWEHRNIAKKILNRALS